MSEMIATLAAFTAEDWFFYLVLPFAGGIVTGLLPLAFIGWGKS